MMFYVNDAAASSLMEINTTVLCYAKANIVVPVPGYFIRIIY